MRRSGASSTPRAALARWARPSGLRSRASRFSSAARAANGKPSPILTRRWPGSKNLSARQRRPKTSRADVGVPNLGERDFMIASILILLAQTEPTPVVIAHGKIQAPRQPQVAVGSNGNAHLTFGDGNRIYYARSSEAPPLKFGEPVLVAEAPNLALGMRRGPRV